VLALAAGCTTMGTGFGSTAAGADPVTFSWKSSDSVSGTMSATLTDGKQYSGQFFEITRIRGSTTSGLSGPGGIRAGAALAALTTGMPDRASSRTTRAGSWPISVLRAVRTCAAKFQLAHPSQGMAGGGRGQCQMPDGKTIDATFPTA